MVDSALNGWGFCGTNGEGKKKEKDGNIPTRSTIPSATPNAHAASTLPPTYLIRVLNFLRTILPMKSGVASRSSNSES